MQHVSTSEGEMRVFYIISDLHLGGRPDDASSGQPGFQFNHSYAALIGFIDWIDKESQHPSLVGVDVELIINGDIVDFLAEDDFGAEAGASVWTGDQADVIKKLRGIAERTRDSKGRGVFEALADFIGHGNFLTLLLGNHDVELALPRVREFVLSLLGNCTQRIKLIYDGEAYIVGKMLVEHGNRYDRWNMVDHSALRQERSVLSRNLPIDERDRAEKYFVPPAGTHLVVHVINKIKSRYRFIDLVKPETNALIPLLLALEPSLGPHIEAILKNLVIVRQLRRFNLASPTVPSYEGALSSEFAGNISLRKVMSETVGADANLFDFPDQTSQDMSLGRDTVQKRISERWNVLVDQARSLYHMLKIRTGPLPDRRRRQLHAALRALNEQDQSYTIDREDPVYLEAATITAELGKFDLIVYGHTHLPKKVFIGTQERPSWYMNTGTWCDVVRLPPSLSSDFETAENDLASFINALTTDHFERYVTRYLSYVHVILDEQNGGRVQEANLHSYCGAGSERSDPLTEFSTDRSGTCGI